MRSLTTHKLSYLLAICYFFSLANMHKKESQLQVQIMWYSFITQILKGSVVLNLFLLDTKKTFERKNIKIYNFSIYKNIQRYIFFFRFFSIIGYYKIVNTVNSLCYTVGLVYLFYIQYYVFVNSKLLICPSPLLPMVTINLFM